MIQTNQSHNDPVQQNDNGEANFADTSRQSNQAVSATSATEIQPNLAERFMQTLQQIEASGDVNKLVALFSDDADLINLAMQEPLRGHESIRQFWQNYLSVFDRIQSRFTHVSEGNGTITLEWVSDGTLASGEPFSYRGVSILETQNGQVQHFRTYYDSAAFLAQEA